MSKKHNDHETPKVTVDIIIEILDWRPFQLTSTQLMSDSPAKKDGIVLVSRKHTPLGWALPGGFVDVGETGMQAAAREALEETGLRVSGLKQFHTYTHPLRDPRQHNVTIVYIAQALGIPQAADDAQDAIVVSPDSMGSKVISELCFDHSQIITDYLNFKRTGKRPTRE